MITNKNWIKNLIILLLFAVACVVCFVVVFIFQLRSISVSHVKNSREYFSVNYENLGNCYVDEGLLGNNLNHQEQEVTHKDDVVSLVDEVLTKIPEHVRPCVVENWAIVFVFEPPEFAYQYLTNINIHSVSAVTVPHIKTVFVFTLKPDSISYVLPHEIGHVLAVEYGAMDYDKSFRSLYALYKEIGRAHV